MKTSVSLEYANAYSEVLEILNNMSKEDCNKIPNEIMKMFKENSNKENKFKYDFDKSFEEQDISKKAKVILSILFRDYWATDIQKEKIIRMQDYKRKQLELEKSKTYNVNVFLNKQVLEEKNGEKVEEEWNKIATYKESILIKIINKIKAIFQNIGLK